MDLTLLYLVVGFVVSALYFEFRVRRFLHRFAPMALERVQSAFFTQDVVKAEDGTERVLLRPNARLEAFLSAVVPVMVAVAVKSLKVKGPKGAPDLTGVDFSNLTSALPALLPLVPKQYQGIVALVAPLLQNWLGGAKPSSPSSTAKNPFLGDLQR